MCHCKLVNETNITFEKVPAPDGQYAISFVAENIAGQSALDEAIITVKNDGLDPAFRGYTDLTYGVTFRYPANWIRPRLTQDGRLFTATWTTNTLLSLFPYTGVKSAEETDASDPRKLERAERADHPSERAARHQRPPGLCYRLYLYLPGRRAAWAR